MSETYVPEMNEFHLADEMFAKRLPDGSVRLRRISRLTGVAARGAGKDFKTLDYIINRGAWISLVCTMSARGEDHGRFFMAEAFHDR